MITLPWQVVAGLLALIGLAMVLSHLRKSDCKDRSRAERNEIRREALGEFRRTQIQAMDSLKIFIDRLLEITGKNDA